MPLGLTTTVTGLLPEVNVVVVVIVPEIVVYWGRRCGTNVSMMI